jgi:hypothetical protein
MLTPERLVAVVEQRYVGLDEPIVVLWQQVLTDREGFRQQIESCKGNLRLVTIVVRGGFDDPNAIMSDLNEAIDKHKPQFQSLPDSRDPTIILLLSRTEFGLPQISSPCVLPHWFPRYGGRTFHITIEDITQSANGPMNVQEARVEQICESLFLLEAAMINRLLLAFKEDQNCGKSFFDIVKDDKKPEEKYTDFLNIAKNYLNEIRNPGGYRPSAREGRSVISRLLRLMQKTSPDEIGRRAKALSTALGVTDSDKITSDDALVAVLLRPANRDSSSSSAPSRFGRNLIIAIYASSQFVTAAMHADDYPSYPLLLLQSMSQNLQTTLIGLRRDIEVSVQEKF